VRSSGVRNVEVSGQEGTKKRPRMPTRMVIMPSRMKLFCWFDGQDVCIWELGGMKSQKGEGEEHTSIAILRTLLRRPSVRLRRQAVHSRLRR